MKITTKKARQIREAIEWGKFWARLGYSTLGVMAYAKNIGFTRFQRKVAVDVYHRNR